MSAFILPKSHLDYLLTAALQWTKDHPDGGLVFARMLLTSETIDSVGQMLWLENHRSVNYRYSEKAATPEYRFEPRGDLNADWVLSGLRCYEYQSCEHQGWDASTAKAFCEALVAEAERRGGKLDEEAPWVIE